MSDKPEATTMFLTSELGSKPQPLDSRSPLALLAVEWVEATPILIPGCTSWLDDLVNEVDRVGGNWGWVCQPRVMYCSLDCVMGALFLFKDCLRECDCCGAHANSIRLIIQVEDVALLTVCCPLCAHLPEAYAHLN